MNNQLNALSIDLEEWYHPELVRLHVPPKERISQVEAATRPLLDLLHRYDVKATFFVVGEVARAHPDFIREIYEAGHEIANHGMTHQPLWALTPEKFKQELSEFASIMRAIIGSEQIIGFRAPTFSLDHSTRWALQILQEQGYLYDSSIFGVRTPLYGVRGCPLSCYRPNTIEIHAADPNQSLIEVPVTLLEIGGWRVPVAGGVYLRTLPFWFLHRALRYVLKQRPLVIYLHPWETYSKTPRYRLSPHVAFGTYYNLAGTLTKLEGLLRFFRFGPMRAVVSAWEEAKRK